MKRVYYICGDDEYLKNAYLDKLFKEAGADDFDIHIFDLDEEDLDAVGSAVVQYPFLSAVTLVSVRGFRLEKITKADKEKLTGILSDIPETTTLILYQDGEMKSSEFFKYSDITGLFAKYGEIKECSKKSPAELRDMLVRGAAKSGCSLSPENAALIVEYAGSDIFVLTNELAKLTAYRNEDEITADDVKLVCAKNIEADVFDIGNNIVAKKADAAVRGLTDLLFLKTDEKLILGTLISFYADVYRLTLAGNASALNNTFSYKNAEKSLYYKKKLAGKYTPAQFGKIFGYLNDADRELKRSPVGGDTVLLKLCGRLLSL